MDSPGLTVLTVAGGACFAMLLLESMRTACRGHSPKGLESRQSRAHRRGNDAGLERLLLLAGPPLPGERLTGQATVVSRCGGLFEVRPSRAQ